MADIEQLNDRFGTSFTQADQLFFDQVAETAVENETLETAAQVNTLENFRQVFDGMLDGMFIDRLEGNEEIVDRILNDCNFRAEAARHLVQEVYARLRNRMPPSSGTASQPPFPALRVEEAT